MVMEKGMRIVKGVFIKYMNIQKAKILPRRQGR
jgi:hypothetical protein